VAHSFVGNADASRFVFETDVWSYNTNLGALGEAATAASDGCRQTRTKRSVLTYDRFNISRIYRVADPVVRAHAGYAAGPRRRNTERRPTSKQV